MQGTILIVDGVSTNRIMLKVQLSAAYYHVVQSNGLENLATLIKRTRPELIVTAMALPDGTAIDLRKILDKDSRSQSIPVIAIAAQNDRTAQLSALRAGIDDVLYHPIDDMILQARIRSLLRQRNKADELEVRCGPTGTLGFAESPTLFTAPSRVAVLTSKAATGAIWRSRLAEKCHHRIASYQINDITKLVTGPSPDVIVVDLTDHGHDAGLRLLTDLSSRSATNQSALIAVAPNDAHHLVADALDRGAHDVLKSGFCAEELNLRIKTRLRHKKQVDRLRNSVRDGLRAALRDPLTGLYNRRYALPQLARLIEDASRTKQTLALMLVDLDHFKQINDRYGHPSGDAVLMETAQRLGRLLSPNDMLARVGGEEFMVAMPNTTEQAAARAAERLCHQINDRPFYCAGRANAIKLTTSIGVVVGPSSGQAVPNSAEQQAQLLISQADRALYEAKHGGRNQVAMISAAA